MHYRRVFTPGASYFFTINLKDRASNLLVTNIHLLRLAVSKVKKRHPFGINGIVVFEVGESIYTACWVTAKA
jgi:putative transposase